MAVGIAAEASIAIEKSDDVVVGTVLVLQMDEDILGFQPYVLGKAAAEDSSAAEPLG
ncbi:uncharacterized protein RCO7_11270 [Rhynchosporium graminicola]|uniref:Uncharacterized protein n=1 Tax=Rhynchosporium graminicola TaxID=2792576 RepID=A0A1E1L801_9HELO|nr:uncharacterized protein RCO7_11270 [Rhynchosporium commune]